MMYDKDGIEVVSVDSETRRVILRCSSFPDVQITYQLDRKVFAPGTSGYSRVSRYWKGRMHRRAAAILRSLGG